MHKTLSGVTVKDAEQGTVSAVFSTFNVIDKDGDLTLPGAIKDGTEVVISAYGHRSHYGELPVGKGVIRTTATEAILEGQFFLDTTHGADAFKTVKRLSEGETNLQEWSYSLHDVIRKSAEQDGRHYWILESIGLIKEVSPVLIGAGVDTRTLSAKGLTSLQDQITAAMGVVDEVIEGAERVVALRAEQGKSLSNVNTESLDGLASSLDRLKALLANDEAPADVEIPEDLAAGVKAAYTAHLRRDLFSHIPAKEA